MTLSLPIVRYECEPGCGACCTQGIIEVDELDLAREPRLKQACESFRLMPDSDYDGVDEDTGEDLGPLVPGWESGGMLCAGAKHPCQLLDADKRCTIYQTRPNCCVAFRPGSGKCQDFRQMAGLPRLVPVSVEGSAV